MLARNTIVESKENTSLYSNMQGMRMSGIEELSCRTTMIMENGFNDITRKSMPIPYQQQALMREDDELVKCYDAATTSRNSLFS